MVFKPIQISHLAARRREVVMRPLEAPQPPGGP